MNDTIKYSEIFKSIQGEGSLTGTPSVFFRTSYCNLLCGWCDTPYTSHEPENKNILLTSALKEILSYDCDHVVITGGEPFVQKKKIEWLCQQLHNQDKHITIETNGTIYHPLIADLISCSPKTRNSMPSLDLVDEHSQRRHESIRVNYESFRKFTEEYDHQFKFVVSNNYDFNEIDEIVKMSNVEPGCVFLMPEGRTKEEIINKEKWLVGQCVNRGYRYSDRLHVRLWDNRRGV